MANLALVGRPSSQMGMGRTFNTAAVGAVGSRALVAIRNAGGKLVTGARSAGMAIRNNGALRQQFATADAGSLGSVALEAAPELGANVIASAVDETELGKSVADMIGVKPSTVGLGLTIVGLLVLPKGKRGMRSKVAKLGLGLAHVVAAGLGRRLPGAVSAASGASAAIKASAKVSGVDDAGTSGASGASGDAKSTAGEVTES